MKIFKSKKSFTERLVRRIFYKYYARNLFYELQLRARSSSADYAGQHMTDAVIFWRQEEILEYCVRQAPTEGLILEFGVAAGKSINIIASAARGREVHGFDSFEGLPEDWTGHLETRGSFSRKGRLPKVLPNVRLHQGWFKETLGKFKSSQNGPVAFLHIDCDLYSSTRDVLHGLADRLTAGAVIVFDEYFNYPGWQQHEFRAWQEFVRESGLRYRYLAMTASDGRVAVVITGKNNGLQDDVKPVMHPPVS
jgi:Predicted O-methyltransferase